MSSNQYQALNSDTLATYLANIESVSNALGGEASSWSIKEVGDGNLNLVFIVSGEKSTLIVKQALPYLRLVGDSWPLPLERAYFEHEALVEEAKQAPSLVPELFHFDKTMALNVMEFCSPHIILRKGFIAGTRYPQLAEHISTFMAETLFKTSDLHLRAADKKQLMKVFCDNTELCKITEDLVFTFPYMEEESNRWTTPELDETAAAFRADTQAKLAAQQLKEKFLSHSQALIHADLHSGSIMVTETDTKVIDPEFAFFGPMGFDIGAFLGNMLLAYFSQAGHATAEDDREEYSEWLLSTIEKTWTLFQEKFLQLWNSEHKGDAYTAQLFSDINDKEVFKQFQADYMQRLFNDSIGFASVKMIRRILGLAHVEDLESIENQQLRAECEKRALKCAREMLVNRETFNTIQDVTAKAKTFLIKQTAEA
jgi:5-methylthioribose kinase